MCHEPIDLTSDPSGRHESGNAAGHRPYLGILFSCCGVYARIYINASGSAFVGHCPRCGGRIEVGISPEGQTGRFFSAY